MLRTLFAVANLAMLAWLPLWFLPRWRFTRWLAEQAVAPFFVALLWLVGAVPVSVRLGLFSMLRDFGSADGVLRLFAVPDFALLIWIQILAWDLFVGLHIYRDNMARGFLPIWLQSLLLFITFWVGPVGYILYYLLRALRRRTLQHRAAPAGGAGADEPAALFQGERVLIGVGLLGLALAGALLPVMAGRGRYIPPEGDLMKPITFCLAVGLYALSLAAFLPVAGFTARGRVRFRWALTAVTLYAYAAEIVSPLAGFDPRFSRAARGVWAVSGALFGLDSLVLVALILIFTWRVLRVRTAPARPLLVLGLRYATLAGVLATAGGVWMIAIQSRYTGPAGNILYLHAAGFHGIQAVPLLAWLLEKGKAAQAAQGWVHAAGAAYLGATVLLLLQTAAGRGLLDLTPMSVGYGALLLLWAALTGLAAASRLRWRASAANMAAAAE